MASLLRARAGLVFESMIRNLRWRKSVCLFSCWWL